MSDKDRLERMLEGVEGWMPLPEAHFLRDLARKAEADIVEIGCYRGRSTIALCIGAEESGRLVHSVDPQRATEGVYGAAFGPADRAAYYRNMLASGMAERAALINLPSQQAGRAWEGPIGLLFVDGDHEYAAVRRDIDIWGPHLISGGVVVFDDTRDPTGGPARVVGELVASAAFVSVATVGKIHALRKR